MNTFIIVVELGNYDAPRTYELNTDFNIMQLYEHIEETKVRFIKVKKYGIDYLVNVNKIVCIHSELPKPKATRPVSENIPL